MKTDRIFGIVVCALALAFVLFAVPSITDDWRKALGSQYFTVGPRFYPYIAGYLALLFGALMAWKPEARLPDMLDWRGPARRHILVLIAITLAYLAIIQVVGFTLASVVMLAVFLISFGQRRWYVVLSVCLLGPLAVELLFLKIFSLKLPTGLVHFSVLY